MFCPNCGSDIGESTVCPNCNPHPVSTSLSSDYGYSDCVGNTDFNAFHDRLRNAFSCTLFLVMTILMTASVALNFIAALSAGKFSIEIIALLFTIAMWLVYTTAKNSDTPLSPGGLKLADGTTTAVIVIGWVTFGVVVLFALFFLFLNTASLPIDFDEFTYSLYANYGYMLPFTSAVASFKISFIGIITIIVAVALALINIFFYKNLKRFIHSIRTSADTGATDIQKAKTVRAWLMVFGILSALSALGSLAGTSGLSSLASGCHAAALIIAFVWINQNFYNTPQA